MRSGRAREGDRSTERRLIRSEHFTHAHDALPGLVVDFVAVLALQGAGKRREVLLAGEVEGLVAK